jgi:hypothetical protein
MFEVLNDFILLNLNIFTRLGAALILLTLGSIFISFEGGIPRVAEKIVSKPKSIFIAAIGGFLILVVIEPLLELFLAFLFSKFLGFVIPFLIILSGITLREWNKQMRWDYKWYWIITILVGIFYLILEIVL